MKERVSQADVQAIIETAEPGVADAIRNYELIEEQYLAASAAVEVHIIGYGTTTTAGPLVVGSGGSTS